MSATDDPSKRHSEVYRRIDELSTLASKDPAQVQKILPSALAELKACLDEQSLADEEHNRALESEERMRALMDHNPSLIFLKDEQGRYVYLNEAYERQFALSEDWYGKTDFDFWPRKSAELFRANDSDVLKSGKTQQFLEDSTGLDGTRYCWLCYKFPFTDSKNRRYLGGIGIDATDRVRAEETLRESEARLCLIAHAGHIGFFEWNALKDTAYWSPEHYKLLGYEPGSPISWQRWLKGVHPEDRDRVVENATKLLERARLEGRVLGHKDEYRFIRPDGSVVWVEADLSVDMVGGETIARGLIRDITERKLAEELAFQRLMEIEDIYRNAPVGLCVLDRDLRFLRINEQLAEINGIPAADHIGKTVRDLMPELADTVEQGMRRILDTGEPELNIEVVSETPACPGVQRSWMEQWLPIKDSQGQVIGLNIVVEEITERKRAEKELQNVKDKLELRVQERTADLQKAYTALEEKELEYRRLAELSPDVVVVFVDGQIVFVNNAAVNVLGASSPDDLLGKSIMEFVHPHYRDIVKGRIKALSEGIAVSPLMYLKATRLDGRVIDAETASASVTYNGHPARMIVGRDITARKAAEAELKQAKEKAEAAVEAKAAFLASMSHELRTPMNAIIGFSNLLLFEDLTPEQRDFVESIKVGGESLLALISDILDFSKLEKEKVMLEHGPLSLISLIEESLDMVAVRASDKGLRLSYTASYGIPDTIVGDQGRLRQVLVNLLANAVKFTDKGEVSLSISSEALGGGRQKIEFAVKDTGIGIAQDKIDHLFSPFTQADTSITCRYGGTGLGLSICKSLVELMGGQSGPGAIRAKAQRSISQSRPRSSRASHQSRLPLPNPSRTCQKSIL